MTDRSDIEAFIRELYAARVAEDIETLMQGFAEDAVFAVKAHPGASPMAERQVGRAQIRERFVSNMAMFDVSDFTILDLLVDGNKVATRWTANIRHTASGQTFPMEIGNFIEIENGKIASVIEFLDTAFVGQLLAKMTA